MPDEPRFELGLTMAGAVSAGAYTAGVLDFLVQALAELEKVRGTVDGGPRHRVVVKAMSGASAGGVITGLSIPPLAKGPLLPPKELQAALDSSRMLRSVLPDLYRLWVVDLALLGPGGQGGLLGTSDLDGSKPILSLLDSSYLDTIATNVLRGASWSNAPLPYLAKDLDLFLTTTNLRGVPYTVRFDGDPGQPGHTMAWHADWKHFRVVGLGTAEVERPWLADMGDSGVALNLVGPKDTPLPFGTDVAWTMLKSCAIATGAFPIGLSARRLDATTDDYGLLEATGRFQGRAWPVRLDPGACPPLPNWPPNQGGRTSYPVPYIAADGGACNNEPFELVHFALMSRGKDDQGQALPGTLQTRNARDALAADRAVIMIDPFPEPPAFSPDARIGDPDRVLARVATSLLAALLDQARFKLEELLLALDERVFSRFLIAPRRRETGQEANQATGKAQPEPIALATGGLNGFLGFFDQRFREHDYQLGRRNCQRFLSEQLRLDARNPLFAGWTERAEHLKQADLRGADGAPHDSLPIIPLVGGAVPEEQLLPWPRMKKGDIDTVMTAIGARAKGLVPQIIRDQTSSGLLRAALLQLWSWIGQDRVTGAIRRVIEAELVARDQHADWIGLAPPVDRAVVAALIRPGTDLRTISGLVLLLPRFGRGEIERAVANLQAGGLIWYGPSKRGEATFTLSAYQPNAAYRIPGVSWLARLVFDLTVDIDRLGTGGDRP